MKFPNKSAFFACRRRRRGSTYVTGLIATIALGGSVDVHAQTNAGIALETVGTWRGPHQHVVAGASMVTSSPSLLDAVGTNVGLPQGAVIAEMRLFWWGSGNMPDSQVDLRLPDGTLQNVEVDVNTDCGLITPKPEKSFWQCSTSLSAANDELSGEYRLEGLSADINAPYDNPCSTSASAACSEYIAAFAMVVVYTDPADTDGDTLPSRFTQLASGLTYLQYVGASVSEPLSALRVPEGAQGRMSMVVLEGDPEFPSAGCNGLTNGLALQESLEIVDGQDRPLCEFVALCDGACVNETEPGRLSPDATIAILQNDDNVPGVLFNGSVESRDEPMHAFDLDVYDLDGYLAAGTYDDLRIGVQTGEDAMMLALHVVTIDEADQDGDGLSDAQEEELGTDPANLDSDGDQLPDGLEVFGGAPGLATNNVTDPLRADSDGDGLCDGGNDVNDAANPCVSGEDTNGNGIQDPGETDPSDDDTDDDGLSDGTEVLSNYPGPFDNYARRPGAQTNPLNPDSDGDGFLDGEEDRNANGSYEPQAGESNPTGDDDIGDAGTIVPDGGGAPNPDSGNPPMPPATDAGAGASCGDGTCDAEESVDSCPIDCDAFDNPADAGPEDDPKLDVAGSAFYTGCGAFTGSQVWWPFALLLAWPRARARRRKD